MIWSKDKPKLVTVQRIQLGPPNIFLPITRRVQNERIEVAVAFGPITIRLNFTSWAGVDAKGFAKVNLSAYSHGKMLFLSINDRANKWKGKIKKYRMSVELQRTKHKYIYRMTACIKDETDSTQICSPNAADELG